MENKDDSFSLKAIQVAACKYGENAYQSPAALFSTETEDELGLDHFQLVAGTPLSYNNYCDLDRLLQTMTHIAATFDLNCGEVPYIAIGAKHGNTCGAGVDYMDKSEVIKKMVTGDLQSLFGGLVMLNFPIDVQEAELLLTYEASSRRLLDGIIAPWFSPEAISMLSRKGDKCRFVSNPKLSELDQSSLDLAPIHRYVRGGLLLQPNYSYIFKLDDLELVKHRSALFGFMRDDLFLAKAICDTSNSNTITIVKDGQLLGNGVGQQSRVNGAELALGIAKKNNHDLDGSVAASDSFFPFTDAPDVLIESGVKVILSTSGSVNDKKVIEFCESKGASLLLIPDVKGRGFFNH